ncbi:F1 sector of membrane-bound ATP synthase, alpha subunit [Hyella patelloides LEGE 07179]|uniref:ATP synthase subunit alpha n=1 Tax=Hyella patelloides LEGE 07179 TaxID=945734 RepID=A0A563VSY2_9CYAN|nr:alternate F1F0 ATPase, F1 subunit alpha [Hyella patelloides]VEP14547.1 F1 sector of membrane-bound ATP synthase, alpha subunit [Hyella patelloides LEGE 07179]
MTDIHSLSWQNLLDETVAISQQVLDRHNLQLQIEEVGTVTYLGGGIARAVGLPSVQAEELVKFPGNCYGMAYNLDRDEVGIILLDDSEDLKAGCEVLRTGRVLDAPVGEELLGRVIDATGRPLDNQGAISTAKRLPVEREAPGIMQRAPVTVPLQTGIKVIDALIPIGRGQRELILGDRATGKTAIALDTIINQKGKDVICVYCAIGQRSSAVAKLIAELRQREAMDYCIVVVAGGETPPGLQYITPYAATTMAEYFRSQGKDVLIVYDDLIQHARAYRELSLLLRRPPGREAFPGDIFYIHSRLLERATHLRPEFGGGSLTALPIVETEAQNISAYIPTNLVSITDGQIYLTPNLFHKGILPAVDVGKSVSRVGGKTQLPAYRAVAGDLRLSYSQFEELEAFSRFGTRLDEATQKSIERGQRVREILKQNQYQPIPVAEQIAVLLAATQGSFDTVPVEKIKLVENSIRQAVREKLPDVCQRIEVGEQLNESDLTNLLNIAEDTVEQVMQDN